jgi:alkyl hydroperoxide reductase subunit AhpC
MKPLFDQYGVTMVALSRDSVEEAAAHKKRDGIEFTLLSDPDLSVITRFGLLHNQVLRSKTFLVGSMKFPLGWPTGFDSMAIPTTLILDSGHVVRVVDQADDYRVRGDESRTRAALESAFGSPQADTALAS